MASTNKTENLGLNLWLPTDKPKREDFVKDNQAIESRISQLSNPNLYINGGLRISQRGTDFTADEKYGVDRFRATGGGTYKHLGETGGIEVTSGSVTLTYTMEDADFKPLEGKTVVQSWSIDGNVEHGTPFTLTSATTTLPALSTGDTLNWVKLEVGETATEFVDVSVAEELARCQRYFMLVPPFTLKGGYVPAEEMCDFNFNFNMRIPPVLTNGELYNHWTVKLFGIGLRWADGGTDIFSDTNRVELRLKGAGAFPTSIPCALQSPVLLDAEIY